MKLPTHKNKKSCPIILTVLKDPKPLNYKKTILTDIFSLICDTVTVDNDVYCQKKILDVLVELNWKNYFENYKYNLRRYQIK